MMLQLWGTYRNRAVIPTFDTIIIVVVWAIINGGLFFHYGIKVVNDSPRYLNYAQKITDGAGWYEPHNVWYLGYVIFIVVVKSLFHTNGAVILFQVLAHGLAAVALYLASQRLFATRGAALISALFFLTWIEVSAWNFYLLAESWYVSLVCFLLYALVSFDGSFQKSLLTSVLVLGVFMTKPTGIAALPAYGVFLFAFYKAHLLRWKPLFYSLVILMVPLFIELLNAMLSTFVLVENYATGEVVYGMSGVQGYAGKEQLLLPAQDLEIPPADLAPVSRWLLFVISNPGYFARLSMTKAWYYLAHIRPYYSVAHNAFIILTLYPLYVLAAIAGLRRKENRPFQMFAITFAAVHVMAIMVTTVDWDGRFLMPLLPLVFLFGGVGVWNTIKPYWRAYKVHRESPSTPT
uniref:Glycosyltransferase family 39 protein n=1 Tax=Roseihalotalea indica TaxID=2867963 RepID=A0AA49GP30_9BACT|nr:glycosyltransferase family 39 protein [Tunicatimonas sp. TK19036]